MNTRTIMKEAVVLLLTIVMVTSTLSVANTIPTSDVEKKEIWLGYDDIQSQAKGDEWFQYDDGEPEYVIGWATNPLIAQFAIRLTNEELAQYDGCKIVGVEWYHNVQNISIPSHNYDMMIYEGNETLPLVQLLNESDIANGTGYAYHEFTDPYTIDASKDTWIVCRPYVYNASATGDYPVGWDYNQSSWHIGKSSWRYRVDLGGWYQYHPVGLNGSWCLHVKIFVPTPILGIESIKGPIGIKALINNTGDASATNVSWTINVTGGFILLGKTKSDTIPVILAGESEEAKIPFVLGFGMPVVITVTASCDEGATAAKSQNATVLFIFVLPK